MQIKTLLNKVYRFKRFVYSTCRISDSGDLIVEVKPRKNSSAECGVCRTPSPVYDHLGVRLFEFIPIWGLLCYFEYRMLRVNCPKCNGVKTEFVPWADGKQHQTLVYRSFLASWAEDLPWSRVAERFRTSWQSVCRAVEWVVEYGLEYRNLGNVASLGVDEVKIHKGHKYLTLVYQLDAGCRRLLWVGYTRRAEAFNTFFDTMENLHEGFCEGVQFICSDMWKPYLKVIRKRLPQALHVLDRFHIRKAFSDAIDKTRREESARLRRHGHDHVLKSTRWCFLKKRSNLTGKQQSTLKSLLDMNLRTVKVYLLTEQFEHFWTYKSPAWAAKFLKQWTRQAMYSRIKPIKDVAKMLRRHEDLILNYFRAKKEISNGITEGLNTNVKVAFRNARGFRTIRIAEIALLHQLGKLPKPIFEHDFC